MDYRLVQLICLMMLSGSTKEQPVDLNTSSNNSDLSSEANSALAEDEKSKSGSMQNEEDTLVPRNSSIERWNHSRMLLKSSTLGYEQWWFLTTQRPIISHKDYPGRPGVATWKEISTSENRQSRKMANSPTSESILSGASCHLKCSFFVQLLCTLLWIFLSTHFSST